VAIECENFETIVVMNLVEYKKQKVMDYQQ